MELTGTWKAIGCGAAERKDILIQDGAITFTAGTWNKPFEKTDKFNLVPERVLREVYCQKLDLVGEEDERFDFIIHEEIMGEKIVIILSEMTIEYDGRGRIVGTTYVREEDLPLLGDDFESKAHQFFNRRMVTAPDDHMIIEGMKNNGFMGMGAMMGGPMMGMRSPQNMPTTSTLPTVEPWDCTCGKKQITGRFCPECGSAKPQ